MQRSLLYATNLLHVLPPTSTTTSRVISYRILLLGNSSRIRPSCHQLPLPNSFLQWKQKSSSSLTSYFFRLRYTNAASTNNTISEPASHVTDISKLSCCFELIYYPIIFTRNTNSCYFKKKIKFIKKFHNFRFNI